jgi:DNA-binding NarL/FixJ family response regulator
MMTSPEKRHDRRLALVVEDQADTRQWLAEVLRETFIGITVAEAPDLESALRWLRQRAAANKTLHFDLALVDLGLPDGPGIELIHEMNTHHPHVSSIVTTIYDDDAHLFDAIAAGAKGYLLKDRDAEMLGHFLRRIDMGEPPLSPSIARRMLEHFRNAGHTNEAAPPETRLTPRETDVLRLIGRGLRVLEAARVLGLSEHTVADYVKAIYAKLNISSRAEAALEAARRGLT